MLITTVGAVISVRDVGDNDRFITVLSPDMGLVEISVKGAKSWVRAIMPQRSFCLFKVLFQGAVGQVLP